MKQILSLYYLKHLVNKNSFATKIVFMFLLSWIYAFSSQVFISLPFEFVPISLQTLVLFLAPLLFGRIALYSTFLWLFQGVLGLPMFFGFSGGIIHLFGPTGGYLIGFLFSISFLSFGGCVKNRLKLFWNLLIALFMLHFFGTVWLSIFVPFNLNMVLFFLIDLLKIFLISFVVSKFNIKIRKNI